MKRTTELGGTEKGDSMVGRRFVLLWVGAALCMAGPLAIMAQVTDLMITKSGNDAVLSWSTGTEPYVVSLSNADPAFMHEQTLSAGLGFGPLTYKGGLTNDKPLQFFQVCDFVEDCMAFAYTGGAVPPPVPQIDSVSQPSGVKVGDVLTINGSGFSTLPTQNLVLFPQGITAASNASPAPTETSFQVTIPRGALSGSFSVQVGSQLSDPMSLTVNAQTGFTHIYGMAFQPATLDIWLTDGGSGTSNVSKLYSMTYNTGTSVWDKTARETAVNGTTKFLGGQGMDSGGYYYYGLNNSSTNGGVRRAPSSPPGAGGAFTQVSPGSGDSIQVAALATSPTIANVVFVAYNDVTTGKKGIKELGSSGPIDNDYGNFGAYSLNLASIAGLALDSSGNLYAAEKTRILKIAPDQTWTSIATGFTQAEGISLYQAGSADAGTLLVVDNGTSTLYSVNLNDSSPTPQAVLTGLSVPRAVACALTPLASSTCSSLMAGPAPSSALTNALLAFALLAEDTQPRQIASSSITVEPHNPTAVWISMQRTTDDQYPAPSFQGGNHQITVTATATPVPSPQRTIYFRVADPPDSSPYEWLSPWCDNKDGSGTNYHAKLWDPGDMTWKDTVGVQTNATTGKASVTLNTSDRYAGDNYVVQASFDNWSSSNTTPATAQTGVITSWKRIYIEKDKMFGKGGLLFADFNKDTCSPCNQILLYDWANIANNDTIVVFDEITTAENGGEIRTIQGAPSDNHDGSVTVTLNANLTKSYYRSSPDASNPPQPNFANGHSGGVGVPSAGFYEADLGSLWETFDDADVGYWVSPDGAGAVPYLAEAVPFYEFGTIIDAAALARRNFEAVWGKNAFRQNYIYLLGCKGRPYQSGTLTAGYSYAQDHYSYIYGESVSTWGQVQLPPFTPAQTAEAMQTDTVHELSHNFWLNRCTDLTCGTDSGLGNHDARPWWQYTTTGCPNANPCLMQYAIPNPPTTINRLCKEDLILGDPNCGPDAKPESTIRTDTDPIP